jgi:hypothetical protein
METPDLPHNHHDRSRSEHRLTFMYVDDGVWEIYLKQHGLIGELEEYPATLDEPWLHYRAVLPAMPRWMPEEFTDDWRCAVDLLVRES